jgi:cytochrome c oxidase cbb3-type subunit 3
MRPGQNRILGLGYAALIALAVGACNKGKEQAGGGNTNAQGNVENVSNRPFHGNVQQARMGRYLFVEYNCSGCHGGLGGGAMGPSLRDTIWKYGGTDQQIHASIADGRPMGMPPWKDMLSDSQIGDMVQYIRSLRTSAEPTFFFIGEPALMDSLGIKPAAGVKRTAQ